MRNNILIFGSSRSGKTMLAKKINKKFNFNIIMTDSVVSAFEKGMPNLNINHTNMDRETLVTLKPFLDAYIKSLNNYNNRQRDINFVIEGSYLDLESYKDYSKFCRVVLVNSLPTYMDYYNQLKKYDKEYDWTSQISDEDLLEYCKNLKKDNDRIIKYCKENNIRYFDTSSNRESVLDSIVNELSDNIYLDKYKDDGKIAAHYGSLNIVVEAKWYLLDSLRRRYSGVMTFDSQFATKDYRIKFVDELDSDREIYSCFIDGINLDAKFTIDNDNRECTVLLDPEHDKQTKKRIMQRMVKFVFLRLFQLKKAIFLHCACVEKDGKAVIISGNPCSGKTVTMLNLLSKGFNYITNDFLIIDYVDGKLKFLPSAKYIGIRKTKEWIETPENKKYKDLESKDKIVVSDDYIMMPPNNLLALNDVDFGDINSCLKVILFPTYTPNKNFEHEKLKSDFVKNELSYQLLFNFLGYNNSPLNSEKYDLYKINVEVKNEIDNAKVWDEILKVPSFAISQNENTNDEYMGFILKQLDNE